MPRMNIAEATKLISGVQGLIGALPGLAAILGGLGVPPSRGLLFGAFIVSIMFVVTVFCLTHKREIIGLERGKKVKYAAIAAVVSGASLLVYLNIFDLVVIPDTLTTTEGTFDIELYLPFSPIGELAELIERFGRHNLVDEGFIEADIEKYRSENFLRYAFNDVLLITLYLLIVVPLNALLTSAVIMLTESDIEPGSGND